MSKYSYINKTNINIIQYTLFLQTFLMEGGNFLKKGVFKTLGYSSSIYFILIYSLSEKL